MSLVFLIMSFSGLRPRSVMVAKIMIIVVAVVRFNGSRLIRLQLSGLSKTDFQKLEYAGFGLRAPFYTKIQHVSGSKA